MLAATPSRCPVSFSRENPPASRGWSASTRTSAPTTWPRPFSISVPVKRYSPAARSWCRTRPFRFSAQRGGCRSRFHSMHRRTGPAGFSSTVEKTFWVVGYVPKKSRSATSTRFRATPSLSPFWRALPCRCRWKMHTETWLSLKLCSKQGAVDSGRHPRRRTSESPALHRRLVRVATGRCLRWRIHRGPGRRWSGLHLQRARSGRVVRYRRAGECLLGVGRRDRCERQRELPDVAAFESPVRELRLPGRVLHEGLDRFRHLPARAGKRASHLGWYAD